MNRPSLVVALMTTLLVGCASSRTYDIVKWDEKGVCSAVTGSLAEGNYRVETREIHSPPDGQDFRARFVGVHHEALSDTRCLVKVRPEEKLGRYRVDVHVDEQNPYLLWIRLRSEWKEEKFLDELGERLAHVMIRNRLKP